ncbi:MAG: histidine kinase [Pyrinomonadaceae bacterium]
MSEDSMMLSSATPAIDFISKIKAISWRTAGLIFGFYTFLALIQFPQIYFYNSNAKNPLPWVQAFGQIVLATYVWAFLTPPIFWLGRRFPIERPKIVSRLAIHFVFSVFFGVLNTILWHVALMSIFRGESLPAILKETFASTGAFLNNVTNAIVFYIAILAFNHAMRYSRKYRDREFRLQQAELEALKTQLHPHFLFNTLNAISALVYVSPPEATKTISQLSDLLRLTLHNDKAQEVTLKEELDFLRKYLQIHQTLLQERLEVEWRIEPETLDALVPNMILQPLVENSIRHGIAPKEDGGRIEVFSRRLNRELLIEIKDNGLGSESNYENKDGGIGLVNTKARLKHLYGEAQSFEISTPENGGWRVSVSLPFRGQTQK